MKKLVILSLIILSATIINTQSKAQASWEVGARFGERGSIEATIPLGAAPRLHPAVYFYGPINNFGVAGYFDWMFSLDGGPTGLNFIVTINLM